MSRRTLLIITAVVILAIPVVWTVAWMHGRSYDDTVKACAKALEHRPEGVKAKPSACEGVKPDDYDALLVGQAIRDVDPDTLGTQP